MPRRYRFKGSAIGAAGVITTPFKEVIDVQAPSVLHDIGGYGSSRTNDFRHRDILHFDEAHTVVTGSRTHLDHDVPTYSTLVKSTVTKLNIMGMVTADRVVANLTSTYRDEADAQPSIKLLGTRFENLRVAGHPVKVDLSVHVLDKYHQHRRLTDAYSKDKEVREVFGNDHVRQHYHKAPPEVVRFLDQPPPEDGTEMPSGPVSLVHTLTPEGKGIECWGHVIYIEGFGTIRFGEVSLSPLTRSVAMIHVNLGCPVEGDLTICAIEDGGSSS